MRHLQPKLSHSAVAFRLTGNFRIVAHKFKELDGLRASSIMLVLACHMLPLGPRWLRLNETAGATGMAIFFSLSGFLITRNLLSGQSVPTFLLRRGAPILPLAYLYLIVAIVLRVLPRNKY
jgi:peptidoglycan/LPS O-acetylase OafA/YrhL